jgi:hypothetical protein
MYGRSAPKCWCMNSRNTKPSSDALFCF